MILESKGSPGSQNEAGLLPRPRDQLAKARCGAATDKFCKSVLTPGMNGASPSGTCGFRKIVGKVREAKQIMLMPNHAPDECSYAVQNQRRERQNKRPGTRH